jgi:tetratricopeptide (TPR) repeat protein
MARAQPDAAHGLLVRVAAGASLVLVLVVPLVWHSGMEDMFRTPKTELALAAWGVLAAVFAVSNRGAALRERWWAAWGGVLAGAGLSALASGQPARVLAAMLPVALAALGWGAIRQLPEPRRRTLERAIIWAAVLEATAALLFLRSEWRPESFGLLPDLTGRYALIGTLGNPADVAVFLVLPALLSGGYAFSSRKQRWPSAAAGLLLAFVIVATGTFTAVIALALGAAVLAWRALPRTRRVPALAALACVSILIVLATPLRQRLSDTAAALRAGNAIWLGSGRAAGYTSALAMFAAHPLTGVGFGLFEANSFRFLSRDALAERAHVLGLETGFGEAHNEALQHAAETGAIGLALAAVGVVLAVRGGARARGIVAPVAPILAAAAVLALAQFPLHLAAIAAQWTVLAALVLPRLDTPEPLSGRGRLRLVAVGVVGALVVALAWQRVGASVTLHQAQVLSDSVRAPETAPTVRRALARAALPHLVAKSRWLPFSWRAAVIVGNLEVDAGDIQRAVASFQRALVLAERPEVRFDVGIALLMEGERDAGMAHLERAVELNPAVFRTITDPDLSRSLRRRLDASGHGLTHGWIYDGTPAATP